MFVSLLLYTEHTAVHVQGPNADCREQSYTWTAMTLRRPHQMAKWLGDWLQPHVVVDHGHAAEAIGLKCARALRHELPPARRTDMDCMCACSNAEAQHTAPNKRPLHLTIGVLLNSQSKLKWDPKMVSFVTDRGVRVLFLVQCLPKTEISAQKIAPFPFRFYNFRL